MNDRCTPATARRLREQGFPQPVPAPGQVWYDQNDSAFVIRAANKDGIWLCGFQSEFNPYGSLVYAPMKNWEGVTYAPTAPDILRELGCKWIFAYLEMNNVFYCASSDQGYYYSNENPAEACAPAWEAKQKP